MVGLGIVEVGLLEHEGHAEHALPEVDRRLPVGTDEGDVMHALRLDLLHGLLGVCRDESAPSSLPRPLRVFAKLCYKMLDSCLGAVGVAPGGPAASSDRRQCRMLFIEDIPTFEDKPQWSRLRA
jgi:hypothetical protein